MKFYGDLYEITGKVSTSNMALSKNAEYVGSIHRGEGGEIIVRAADGRLVASDLDRKRFVRVGTDQVSASRSIRQWRYDV